MKLKVRLLFSKLAQLLYPGYSFCGRCKMPWSLVELHNTHYNNHQGCFPLCEDCWNDLSINDRLPYYEYLVFYEWGKPDLWKDIEQAVLNGK